MPKAKTQERATFDLWPEAGRRLGLSRTSTYAAANRGDIPGLIRIGRRWLVSRVALERVLNAGNAGQHGER